MAGIANLGGGRREAGRGSENRRPGGRQLRGRSLWVPGLAAFSRPPPSSPGTPRAAGVAGARSGPRHPSPPPAWAPLPARAPALPASSTEANRAGSLRQEFIVCAAPAGRGSPGERSGCCACPSTEGAQDPNLGTHIIYTQTGFLYRGPGVHTVVREHTHAHTPLVFSSSCFAFYFHRRPLARVGPWRAEASGKVSLRATEPLPCPSLSIGWPLQALPAALSRFQPLGWVPSRPTALGDDGGGTG